MKTWLSGAARRLWAFVKDGTFGPQTATDLAICRVFVYGYVFFFLTDDQSPWGLFCDSLYHPIGIFRWLSLPCLPPATMKVVGIVYKYSALAAGLGFAFRLTAPLTAVFGVYIIGIGNMFGKVFHSTNAVAATLVFWAFSRAADKWSVDAWLLSKWKRRPLTDPEPSGEYRWPVRVVWVFVASVYGASGYAKYRVSGWEWAFSNNLQLLFIEHQFHHHPPTMWGPYLAGYPVLCQYLALFALLTEMSAPLMLLHRYLRAFLAPSLMGLQFGIYLFMGIVFHPLIPLFLCLIPWSAFGRSVASLIRRARGVPADPVPELGT
jgi:hypothetical protein